MISIQINLNTDAEGNFTPAELQVLKGLLQRDTEAVVKTEKRPVAEKPKRAPQATPEPQKEASPAEPEPKEEAAPVEPAGGSSDDLKKRVTQRASDMVQQGKLAEVKTELGNLGAKRVSDLKDSQLEEFLSATEGYVS